VSPYLSFVVAARNDNYGGDFLHRMQVFVNVLLSLWAKHNLDAELVIVEWNPPEHELRLEEAIAWPNCLKPGLVRIVEVPGDIHNRLPNSERMPMFEYIAKNVGIRRAAGEYVLVTNPDIIFSNEIIKYFASRRLQSDSLYRADRYDVAREVPLNAALDQQLQLCARHAFRVQRMGECVPTRRLARYRYRLGCELSRMRRHGVLREFIRRGKELAASNRQRNGNHRPALPPLHLRCPGDFLLMANQWWGTLRGHPELATHSHIDSYMVITAAIAGLQQTILPHPIYHQEHDRSEQAERPLTVLSEIPAFKKMLETQSLRITNDESWGLGQVELSTIEVGSRLPVGC
jgi:hypothetical protein